MEVSNVGCDCSPFSAVQKQVDKTPVEGACGSDVVEMVIAKISNMGVFDSDHHLLRRIAYVETNDGISGVPPGGIWAVDESKLNVVLTASEPKTLCEQIDQKIKVKFNLSNCSLSQPLVSGLVARLYLHHLEITKNLKIPLAAAIEDQAKFWHNHYHSGTRLTVDDFKQKVIELEKREGQLETY